MHTLAVIPARLGSTRFPRKVLYPWQGRPLLYHVWRRVTKAREIDRVVIATDSTEIQKAAEGFGAEVVMTSSRCRTGTDRVAEALRKLGGDIVINVQADSFNLAPPALDKIVSAMKKDRSIRFATMARPIRTDEELFDPNKVKVVAGIDGHALWFSRFPIPYSRGALPSDFALVAPRHHLGVYVYTRETLLKFASLHPL